MWHASTPPPRAHVEAATPSIRHEQQQDGSCLMPHVSCLYSTHEQQQDGASASPPTNKSLLANKSWREQDKTSRRCHNHTTAAAASSASSASSPNDTSKGCSNTTRTSGCSNKTRPLQKRLQHVFSQHWQHNNANTTSTSLPLQLSQHLQPRV